MIVVSFISFISQISNIKKLKRAIVEFYEGMEFNPSALPFPDDVEGLYLFLFSSIMLL